MPKLLPLLLACCLALAAPGAAQAGDQLARIDSMSLQELDSFVRAITVSVGQDTLRLQPAAQRGQCLELTRAANSFALAYEYLAAANKALEGKPARETLSLKAHVIQSRVLTFAARVRAEEWLGSRCASFVPPAEHADDPRYARPAKLATAEFTQAVIEARQAAEANLAGAVAAGLSGKCAEAGSAAQAIRLFVPYLDKLTGDLARRPAALGPRASRRGLEISRNQLVAAANKLDREFGARCAAARATDPAPEAGSTQ